MAYSNTKDADTVTGKLLPAGRSRLQTWWEEESSRNEVERLLAFP